MQRMRRGIARFMEREVTMKRPRPRKQLLLKLGVFLLLGAIVNVAVACRAAALVAFQSPDVDQLADDDG